MLSVVRALLSAVFMSEVHDSVSARIKGYSLKKFTIKSKLCDNIKIFFYLNLIQENWLAADPPWPSKTA